MDTSSDTSRRPRRCYSAEERERALERYVEVGPAEAGRETGIPSATIRKWAERSGARIRDARKCSATAAVESARLTWAQRRGEIVQRAGEAAAAFLEQAIEAGPRAAADWMRAFKIGVDTAQALDAVVDQTTRDQKSGEDFEAEVEELLRVVRQQGVEDRALRGDPEAKEFLRWQRERDSGASGQRRSAARPAALNGNRPSAPVDNESNPPAGTRDAASIDRERKRIEQERARIDPELQQLAASGTTP
jgi:transposase-like protein